MNAVELHSRVARSRRRRWSHPSSGRARFLRATIWAAAMLVCLAIPCLARAANHEWCVRYKYDSPDRAYGDFGTGQYWNGRGLKLIVHVGGSDPYLEVTASRSTGCFSFTSQFTNNMTAWVGYNAVIGKTGALTSVVLWDSPDTPAMPVTQFSSIQTTQGTDGVYRTALTLDSNEGWEEALASIAYTFHAIVNSGTFPASLPTEFTIRRQMSTPINNAVAWKGYISAGSPFRSEKFLLAHEAGHSLSFNLGDVNADTVAPNWSFFEGQANLLRPTCRWDEDDDPGTDSYGHAMASQEHSEIAFNEGFAHFISAITWNDRIHTSGVFKYYKQGLVYGYTQQVYPLDIPSPWPFGWLHDASVGCNCDAPSRMNCTGSGNSLDWVRALWAWGSGGGTRPSTPQMFIAHYKAFKTCSPDTRGNMYSRFRSALEVVSLPQGVRWDFKTGSFGLDTTPAGQAATCY